MQYETENSKSKSLLILNTNFAVKNLQLSVGIVQLLAPTFLNPRRHWVIAVWSACCCCCCCCCWRHERAYCTSSLSYLLSSFARPPCVTIKTVDY